MARSVETVTPLTLFLDIGFPDDDNPFWFEELRSELFDLIQESFPSMSFNTKRRFGRETSSVCTNGHSTVTISTYFSVAAIGLVPDPDPLAQAWCRTNFPRLQSIFRKSFGRAYLTRLGSDSTGSSYYSRAEEAPTDAL